MICVRGCRVVVAAAAVALTSLGANLVVADALPPPSVDPSMVPADGQPGPEQPIRQSNVCAGTTAIAQPDVVLPASGFTMLNIAQAWKYSTGNGVSIALIDTGVTPNPRLPVIPGGDYITGGDGLSDCDAHGTIVASLIAAAPQGAPMPPAMPTRPAFPVPEAVPIALNGASPPAAPDGVAGVAPHATIISIRQSSRAFEPSYPGPGDTEARRKAGTIATLAKAIVHAANLGAQVINISVTACVSAADPVDQRAIGSALWYAATVKDAVVVSAAGNEGDSGCAQNPAFDPLKTDDPRDWHQVRTISSPSWFSDYVLSVGAVDVTGAPVSKSLAGPWVGVAAPGVGVTGLSPQTGGPVNAYQPARPGEAPAPFWGTSFSAAYVSGVVALVRAKYAGLSAHQVIHRITQTAHNPARGVDNQIGFGMVDPLAALTFDVPPGDRTAANAQTRVLTPPPAPPPPDHRARTVALAFAGAVVGSVLAAAGIARLRRQQ